MLGQVAGDFRACRTKTDGKLTDESLEKYRAKVAKVMAPPVENPNTKEKPKASKLKDPYIANEENMQALDHAIKISLDSAGLQHFVSLRPPARLGILSERYMVEIDELPDDIQ